MVYQRVKNLFSHPLVALVRPYRRRYWLGIGALALVDGMNVGMPLMVKQAVDAMGQRDFPTVAWAGAAYFLMMAVLAAGRYLWRVYFIGTSHLVAADCRLRLYGHLQSLPLESYGKMRTGDLMSRATNDIEAVRMAVGPGVLVVVDAVLMLVFMLPVMFWLSPKLALLALACFPLVPWLTRWLGDGIDRLFESLQERLSRMGAFAHESFQGIRLIKSLVLEGANLERFRRLSGEYREEGIRLARYESVFGPALALFTNIGIFLILLAGSADVLSGALTLGTFVAFQRFVVQLTWPMEAVGWGVTLSREGTAAHRRLQSVFDVPPAPSVRVPPGRPLPGDSQLELRGLRFSYGHDGFGLAIEAASVSRGTKVGLVGPVGSGKSTLFQLLMRLYEPAPGTVFLEGRDVASIPLETVRREIALVEQQVHLFNEAVAGNVAMGTGREAGHEELDRLAETAVLGEELARLPLGYRTRLGERGVSLSGGQRQRLALMRALFRRPKLLLLDDCFSAVDVDVERSIIKAFLERYPDLTVLMATHRPSILPLLDEVWVLDAGRLLDRGHHRELWERSAWYRSLWGRKPTEPLPKPLVPSREVPHGG